MCIYSSDHYHSSCIRMKQLRGASEGCDTAAGSDAFPNMSRRTGTYFWQNATWSRAIGEPSKTKIGGREWIRRFRWFSMRDLIKVPSASTSRQHRTDVYLLWLVAFIGACGPRNPQFRVILSESFFHDFHVIFAPGLLQTYANSGRKCKHRLD